MFARLTAKAVLAAVAIAMAFFVIGLLGMALATALVAALGAVGGYAVAGAVFLVPPLGWALVMHFTPRQKQSAPLNNELTPVLLSAGAKETPWVAIFGAGVVGAANIVLNRNKS